MKQTLILALLLLIAVAVYFAFFFGSGSRSLKESETAFALTDTTAVTRIVLTQVVQGREKQKTSLDRQEDGSWLLDGKYPALRVRVSRLLGTMSNIRVREVLIDKGVETGNAILNTFYTEVEVWDKKGLIKRYKLSTETRDSRGTLMRMDGSETPYVVELPGHQGYLNGFYSIDPAVWRENLIFDASPERLAGIAVSYRDSSERSFVLAHTDSLWMLQPGNEAPDAGRLAEYLALMRGKVYAESFAAAAYPGKYEALSAREPEIRFQATYKDGTSRTLRIYRREDNPNNYFGWIEGENELLTIQTFVFARYLRTRAWLLGQTSQQALVRKGVKPL
ncbi:MAG: hypothetical protein EAZ89_11855 [Bacteroidetes bacterium]|nr:MAG: hypothetical protein EAZ89_11855 [Bacteroidota bacterium]